MAKKATTAMLLLAVLFAPALMSAAEPIASRKLLEAPHTRALLATTVPDTSGVTTALQAFLAALLSSLNSAQTYQNFDNLTGPVVKDLTTYIASLLQSAASASSVANALQGLFTSINNLLTSTVSSAGSGSASTSDTSAGVSGVTNSLADLLAALTSALNSGSNYANFDALTSDLSQGATTYLNGLLQSALSQQQVASTLQNLLGSVNNLLTGTVGSLGSSASTAASGTSSGSSSALSSATGILSGLGGIGRKLQTSSSSTVTTPEQEATGAFVVSLVQLIEEGGTAADAQKGVEAGVAQWATAALATSGTNNSLQSVSG